MAAVDTTNGTYLASLFNPEVIGDYINDKLTDAIKLSPLATTYNNLVGQPGDEIKLPYYNYIGTAAKVAEGQDIPIKKLTEQTKKVQIVKYGIGVQVTDEAVLSAYGDTIGQATYQIALSIASGVDDALYTALAGATLKASNTSAMSADVVADALTLFGEDIDGSKVLLTDPDGYAVLRKANGWVPGTEVGANMIMSGTVGTIYGCQVVVSNKMKGKKAAYIVKPGALAIYTKRDVLIETDRDIINKSTVITGDKHFATYLLDESKAIAIPITAGA